MHTANPKRFTDRLFYAATSDELLHISYVQGSWYLSKLVHDVRAEAWTWMTVTVRRTYEELFRSISWGDPILLVEES